MNYISFTLLTSLIALIHSPHCEAGYDISTKGPDEDSGSSRALIKYEPIMLGSSSVVVPRNAQVELSNEGRTLVASVSNGVKLYYFSRHNPDDLDRSFNDSFEVPSDADSLNSFLHLICTDLDTIGARIGKNEDIAGTKETIAYYITANNIKIHPEKKVKMHRSPETGTSLLRLELENSMIAIFSVCTST